MPLLPYLQPGEDFPPSSDALAYPNGLLAAGGELNAATLLAAYRRGLFPWYEAPQPVLWWTPDPRSVLPPAKLRVSRSLRRTLRRRDWTLTADTDFSTVMRECSAPRPQQQGTWIDSAMIAAYSELHALGWAHSIEVRDGDGAMIGGLYGVCIGRVFFGESMFARQRDASKAAMVALAVTLQDKGVELIDCQVESEHLNSLGARAMDRVDFERALAQTVSTDGDKAASGVQAGPWALRADSSALLARLVA